MAKNLKLTIKNTQLAEALKLNTLKKAAGPAKKKAPMKKGAKKEAGEEEKELPAAEAAPVSEPIAPAEPVQETPPKEAAEKRPKTEEKPAPAPAPTPEVKRAEPEIRRAEGVERPAPAARPHAYEPSTRPPYQQQQRPPHSYPPRQQQGWGDRRPYQTPRPGGPHGTRPPGSGAPYQRREGYGPRPGGPGAPYQRREGGYPPSSRPPYAPRGDQRPPYQRPLPPKEPPRGDEPQRKKPKPKEDDSAAKKGAGFKEFRDMKNIRRTDESRSFDSRDRQGLRDRDDEEWRKRRPSKQRTVAQQEEIIRPKNLKVRIPITIKDLASEMKLKASQLISKLFMQGVVVTLNDFLDDETTIQLLGHEFECEITIDTSEEERVRITDKTIKQEIQENDPSTLTLRPPVVTFMGHVDHGKTSLIDAIRKTDIAAGEAGAITQHIGAFKCHTAVGDLTILDTPGHEAFSEMRARGADVTDIVVLVIAGDEGMRTQTIEAMQQAKTAKVPIVIAINKSDKPNFNAENIYRQLAEHELLPEVWGGTTITVNCSALTGAGIKELLEMLALQAEVLELKANPQARARGTVIESEMHKGLGAVATLLVQNGTLRAGDALVFAEHWARVKTMHDEWGKEMQEAGPSAPVKITGLSGLPGAGSEFIAVINEREARELAFKRVEGAKHTQMLQTKRAGLENLLQQKVESKERKILNLILRADVQGSLEALKNSLLKIETKKVELNIISAGVGEISESDIQLAAASKATIIGFHTQVEVHAENLIKQTKVIVKTHDIIYHAVEDVKGIMLALLDKIPQETDTGKAVVKAVFKASQLGNIAGCQVTDGTIRRNGFIRVVRDDEVIWKGPIASLKRVKEDVREVGKGFECGIVLQNYGDVKEGDVLQAYEITYLEQTL